MNRTDRLLAIVLELQARRYTRADDLAAQFEVSVRTIYRDVLALCEVGVPVVATPGYGYTLAPGYFLPPLMFSTFEAAALLLGAAFVAEQVDALYQQAVEAARKKIEKLLPEATRQDVEIVRDSLRFVGHARPHGPEAEARLATIRRAILDHEVLYLTYHARHGEPGGRIVEPHGLVCVNGRWLLAAYCRAREAMRSFRLDRIDKVTALKERFTRRAEFTGRCLSGMEQGAVEVRALFTPRAIRWAREDCGPSFVGEEPHAEGVVMVFRPRDTRDLLPWLLSWGAAVRVLAPPEMRDELKRTAQSMAALYADEQAGRSPEAVGGAVPARSAP